MAYWKQSGLEKDVNAHIHTYPEVRYVEKHGLWLGILEKLVIEQRFAFTWRFK
jgi:hypothetical protein